MQNGPKHSSENQSLLQELEAIAQLPMDSRAKVLIDLAIEAQRTHKSLAELVAALPGVDYQTQSQAHG